MIRSPSIKSIYVSTGIPKLLVSRTYLASALSIRWKQPILLLTVFRTFLVPIALRKLDSLEIIVLNDFLANVLRLNSF